MTIFEIILSCIGLVCCAILVALCVIVIFGIACWIFKTEVDITPENDKEVKHDDR